MVRKAIWVLLIAGSLFFSYRFLSIGLPMGIIVIVFIDVIVFLLTGKKEDVIPAVEKAGEWGRDRIEILGTLGEQAADTASVLAVNTVRVAGTGIKAAYREMGGAEGAKKAVDELAKASGEVLKVGGYALVKGVETIGNATKDIAKQVEEDKRKKQHENLLEDVIRNVDFVVMDDD
jgi:hypothetical protein